MKLTLLGTGNPVPTLRRAGSSYLLRTGADVILFDHGPGANWRLMQAGYKATDVTHVFFTHLHYDHCVDFVRLFANRWDMGAGKVAPMKLYGPPGTQAFVERLFGGEGAFSPDLRARTENQVSIDVYISRGGVPPRAWPEIGVRELAPDDVVEGDGWRLTLAEVPHVQPQLVCYGFRFETADGVFTCSGDSGPCEAMHRLAADADVLVHMCSNISQKPLSPGHAALNMGHLELAALGRDARVNILVVSHINPGPDRSGIRERLIAEMGEIYSGTLIWAEDLMEFEIGGDEGR